MAQRVVAGAADCCGCAVVDVVECVLAVLYMVVVTDVVACCRVMVVIASVVVEVWC